MPQAIDASVDSFFPSLSLSLFLSNVGGASLPHSKCLPLIWFQSKMAGDREIFQEGDWECKVICVNLDLNIFPFVHFGKISLWVQRF